MTAQILAQGTPGTSVVITGTIVEWDDGFLDNPEPLSGAVVYDRGQTPLFRAAFIAEQGAKALLMAEGGKNYHPLILASEAGLPAIAGVGNLKNMTDPQVTLDVKNGTIYAGSAFEQITTDADADADFQPGNLKESPNVYVNVGYPSAIEAANRSGAAGIGLLRTEFAAVKTLALNLDQLLDDGRHWRDLLEQDDGNEADALYTIAQDTGSKKHLERGFRDVVGEAVAQFRSREVIVRTLDIARRLDEPMGNRGIRRCVGSGGETIRLLCNAIREVLAERGGQIGLILPLVSHYEQIQCAVECLLESGLNLKRTGSNAPYQITFGWEIEQPAASQNNDLWLAAFTAEFGQPPHMIGIGTNDLTQFTVALGRDVASEEPTPEMATYLGTLYDEHDFSVVRQILEAAVGCRQAGCRVFLLGQVGADPMLAPLMFAYGVTPSVATNRVAQVQRLAATCLEDEARKRAINTYRDWVVNSYPSVARSAVIQQLDAFFCKTRLS
jgi:phosphoenolpyruvate-protein kinase (PTS system EI component)